MKSSHLSFPFSEDHVHLCLLCDPSPLISPTLRGLRKPDIKMPAQFTNKFENLNVRDRGAYTRSRARAEGKQILAHLLNLFRVPVNPTFWPEIIHVFAEDGFVPVEYPGVDAYYGVHREMYAMQCDAAAWIQAFKDETYRRMDSKGLVDDG